MAIAFGDKETKDVGSWQEFFVPSYTERIKNLGKMPSEHRRFAWSGCALK